MSTCEVLPRNSGLARAAPSSAGLGALQTPACQACDAQPPGSLPEEEAAGARNGCKRRKLASRAVTLQDARLPSGPLHIARRGAPGRRARLPLVKGFLAPDRTTRSAWFLRC